MQKTLIIILLVCVVGLSGVIVYQKLTPTETTPIVTNQPVVNQPVVNQPANNQPSTNCVKEGELLPTAGQLDCCSGLNSLSRVEKYDKDCNIIPGPSGYLICTACGNGVCGTGENQCNCPADCK